MTQGPDEVDSSPIVRRETRASRREVWAVLADGWTYSQWVVGNSRIRAVDPDWPEPGSTIHHSIGVWPAVINDSTVVDSSDDEHQIVLIANTRPLGKARVTIRLHDVDNGGCLIEMAEVPVTPPMSWLPNSVALAGIFPRNRESTWRLAALAERRTDSDVASG